MLEELSNIDQIEGAVKFDSYVPALSADFSLVDTYGSMIGNREYSNGYFRFKDGVDAADTYIYRAISAIGNDIGDTVYQNIRRYIELASDVDLCKVVSIRSMLRLFGFDYTILDSVASMPREINGLLDVLSIKKKYLMKSGIVSPKFLSALYGNQTDVSVLADDSLSVDFKKFFIDNTLTLSSDLPDICYCGNGKFDIRKLKNAYIQDRELSTRYVNSYGYQIDDLSDRFTLSAGETSFIFNEDDSDCLANLTGDGQSWSVVLSNIQTDSELTALYPEKQLVFTFGNVHISENTLMLDDDRYLELVAGIFKAYLNGKINQTFVTNFIDGKTIKRIPIYEYLGTMYFDQDIADKIKTYSAAAENAMLSAKIANHVPVLFDEESIVDNIENGLDSLDSYQGAELSILNMEIARRAQAPQLADLDVSDANTEVLQQNRYYYYRRREVAEYANFIDNFCNQNGNLSVYSLNQNYRIVGDLSANKVITYENGEFSVNDDMVSDVADRLAALAQYICRVRDKLKIQTQKNFMKGTNLLLIYLVNEYLNEYARYNRDFFTGELLPIYAKLSCHQFADDNDYLVKIQEYWDNTEYRNIATPESDKAIDGDTVNDRYWELTSTTAPNGKMNADGSLFTLNQIEQFYLKTLNMSSDLAGKIQPFLCALYDIGADRSFIADLSSSMKLSGYLSVFSSILESGESAYDVFETLVDLSSAYLGFDSYIDHSTYVYPGTTLENQIKHVIDTHIYPALSNEYLSAVDDVYDANIESIDDLCADLADFTQEYQDFINSEYSFYYNKSSSKYSYAGQNVESAYLHDYYVDNPAYMTDGQSIYNTVFQLARFSTISNIQNWDIIDCVSCLVGELVSMSSDIDQRVIQNISANADFIDPCSPAFKTEMQYTYTYLNGKIDEKKALLLSKYEDIKSQLETLQGKYDDMNTYFNDTFAALDYPRKKQESYTDGSLLHWCKDAGSSKKYKLDFDYDSTRESKPVPEIGDNAYMYVADSGNYEYGKITFTPYDPTDTLLNRISTIITIGNICTLETTGGDLYYGMRDSARSAIFLQISSDYLELCDDFDDFAETVEEEYGISPEGEDLKKKMSDLRTKLNGLEDDVIYDDGQLRTYSEYLSSVNLVLNRGLPQVETAYNGIFTNSTQTEYISKFVQSGSLTIDELSNMYKYCVNKDSQNYSSISSRIYNMLYVEFPGLIDRNNSIRRDLIASDVQCSLTDGTLLENYIAELYELVTADKLCKTMAAGDIIESEKSKIKGYRDTIEFDLEESLDEIVNFDIKLSARLDELNFFDHDIYQRYRQLYLTYGGNEYCYDPYYNIKNIAHPSYQVHPFMWNFLAKTDFSQTLIENTFEGGSTQELEDASVESKLSGYLNKFGQPIDLWKNYNNGFTDYTGYASRYEISENKDSSTGKFGEAIDYDGGFYPPAMQELLADLEKCAMSLSVQKQKSDCVADVVRKLNSFNLASHVGFDEYGYVVSSDLYNELSDDICRYSANSQAESALSAYLYDQNTNAATISREGVLNAVSSAMNETFYGRYYVQLGLYDEQLKRTAQQILEYAPAISAIAAGGYDIYRYGLDQFGNAYILYKTYGDDTSYQARRDTLGQLWTRMSGQPIAFPAFNGSLPQYYIYEKDKIQSAILKIAETVGSIGWTDEDHTAISSIDGPMEYFYDFEISKDQTFISLIAFNFNYVAEPRLSKYENSIVVSGQFKYKELKSQYLKYLQFYEEDRNFDYIDFSSDSTLPGKHSYEFFINGKIVPGRPHPKLAGCFMRGSSSIDFIYTPRKYVEDGDWYSEVFTDLSGMADNTPGFFAVEVRNGQTAVCFPENGIIQPSELSNKVVGDQTCVGYDRVNDEVVIAFNSECLAESEEVSSCTAVSAIDFIENTDGLLIDDPRSSEMNSHDMFNTDLAVVRYRFGNQTFTQANSEKYNVNADISYRPQYPGSRGESRFYSAEQSAEYYNIELLGASKNIDGYISRVNPGSNPYFDYGQISEKFIHGRVYEDYADQMRDMFITVNSPYIGYGSANSDARFSITKKDEYFLLSFNLDKINDFSDRDYQNMDIIVYSRNSSGKNPYYVGQLNSLSTSGSFDFIKLAYNESGSDDVISATQIIDLSGYSGSFNLVAGTYCNTGATGIEDSNHIDGFTGIAASYQSKTLIFKFTRDSKCSNPYIPEGAITIVFYNAKNIDVFKYYHLFDVYGAVNCYYDSAAYEYAHARGMPDDKIRDGWCLRYKDGKQTTENPWASFYYDEFGRRVYLGDIELSDYTSLDQIGVLAGSKNLSFKLGEDIFFGIDSGYYYYPSLNISYPITTSQYIANSDYVKFGYPNFGDIFGENDLFYLNVDDIQSILSDIGDIDIPLLMNAVDDLRVFEDYLSTDISGNPNYSKYDASDPRSIEFAHVSEENGGVELSDGQLSDCTIFNIPGSIYAKNSENGADSDYTEYVSVSATPDNCDISKFGRIYVNYAKRDNSEIDLYFNYGNYLNSPFIKIEDSLIYNDIIDGTYLKLQPGEDGILDLIVQFKHYSGGLLQGYKNARLLSYHIYNVSDDKPKFLIKRIYRARNGEFTRPVVVPHPVHITISDVDLDLTGLDKDSYVEFDVDVNLFSDYALSAGSVVYLDYPMAFAKPVGVAASDGILKLTMTGSSQTFFKMKFRTCKTVKQIETLLNGRTRKYLLSIADSDINAMDEVSCITTVSEAHITVTPSSTYTYNVLGYRSNVVTPKPDTEAGILIGMSEV